MKLYPSFTALTSRRLFMLVAMLAAASAVGAVACSDLSGSSTSVLSIQFDTLPAPSVVVGDTLRDTTGTVVRPVVRAFNFRDNLFALEAEGPVYGTDDRARCHASRISAGTFLCRQCYAARHNCRAHHAC